MGKSTVLIGCSSWNIAIKFVWLPEGRPIRTWNAECVGENLTMCMGCVWFVVKAPRHKWWLTWWGFYMIIQGEVGCKQIDEQSKGFRHLSANSWGRSELMWQVVRDQQYAEHTKSLFCHCATWCSAAKRFYNDSLDTIKIKIFRVPVGVAIELVAS